MEKKTENSVQFGQIACLQPPFVHVPVIESEMHTCFFHSSPLAKRQIEDMIQLRYLCIRELEIPKLLSLLVSCIMIL